jgi:hypothetical protein
MAGEKYLGGWAYAPATLAAAGETTVVDSDTTRALSDGRPTFLQCRLTGGGTKTDIAGNHGTVTTPAVLRVTEYSRKQTSPAAIVRNFVFPGGVQSNPAMGDYIIPLFNPGLGGDNASKFKVSVVAGDADHSAANNNQLTVDVELWEGLVAPSFQVNLNATLAATTCNINTLWGGLGVPEAIHYGGLIKNTNGTLTILTRSLTAANQGHAGTSASTVVTINAAAAQQGFGSDTSYRHVHNAFFQIYFSVAPTATVADIAFKSFSRGGT